VKKIIRLTESDLHRIIKRSVSKILREGVLGNDWRQNEDDALNNYEPFEDQIDRYEAETEFRNQHSDALGWNDDEAEGYEEDPDWHRDDVSGWNGDISDGDLYRGTW